MCGREKVDRLRLLVISNLYPPKYLGGYELGCADIVDALRERGHEVTVLTTRHGLEEPRVEGYVHRCLSFRPDYADGSLAAIFQREREDQRTLARLIAVMKPDLIYVFSLYGASMALLLTAQRTGCPVVYAFSSEWLEPQYQGDPWLGLWAHDAATRHRRALKWLVRRFAEPLLPTGLEDLNLCYSYFTSRRLRELFLAKGLPVEKAEIIHWGVDLRRFRPEPRQIRDEPVRLLFAGRLARDKGLHTVVEAMEIMAKVGTVGRVVLSVAGPPQDSKYLAGLLSFLRASPLREHVRFLGQVPWERMPELYQDHEVYLLPSVFEEPFSIGLLEAMASGLAVVGTTTGGSREVLVDGDNSLTFPAEDAPALAAQLQRVLDPTLRARLSAAGRQTVEQRYPLERIHSKVEAFLQGAVAQHRAGRQRGRK